MKHLQDSDAAMLLDGPNHWLPGLYLTSGRYAGLTGIPLSAFVVCDYCLGIDNGSVILSAVYQKIQDILPGLTVFNG
jgi:hypothetical protein